MSRTVKPSFIGLFFIALVVFASPVMALLNSPVNVFDHSIKKDARDTTFLSGYYDWDPYQYLIIPEEPTSLTGLDVEISKLVMKKIGKEVQTPLTDWGLHQKYLAEGSRDFGMGAFYTDERAKTMYYSVDYRDEENSLFLLRRNLPKHSYKSIEGFLKYWKKNKLKIGVVSGYKYADQKLNDFIQDPKNKDLVVITKDDKQSLRYTLAEKIDAFLADRVVGATIIWRGKHTSEMAEKYLAIKAPVYMIVSKKAVTEKTFNAINNALKELKSSSEFKKTIFWYLFPVLLLQTVDTYWFHTIITLAIIATALASMLLAIRSKTTLFGAFILTFIPIVGGGAARDIMLDEPVWIFKSPSFMVLIIAIVVGVYALVKLLEKFTGLDVNNLPPRYEKSLGVILVLFDAMGLAAFTVIGVLMALVAKCDPLWMWGPFFAFLTGVVGGLMRDMVMRSHEQVNILYRELYSEIAVFWGLVLSIYFTATAMDMSPDRIPYAMLVTMIGAFLTRVAVYWLKIPNIGFMKQNLLRH